MACLFRRAASSAVSTASCRPSIRSFSSRISIPPSPVQQAQATAPSSWMPVPYVTETVAGGWKTSDIFSRLLAERIICLNGQVDDPMSATVTAQLLFLEAENPEKPISLYINSPGGSVTAGMAIYDTMNYIRCPVTTICMGQAASMGSLLLAGGSAGNRFILPHSRVMIHQPSGGYSGKASDIADHAKEILRVRDQLNRIYQKHLTRERSLEEIEKVMERDYFMDAKEALEFGIVDQILEKREVEKKDIFVKNVAPRANHTELRLFLRDSLGRFNILAFDVFKKIGYTWAIITVGNAGNAQEFISYHESLPPSKALTFKGLRLHMNRSNRGQPDILKVRVLQEKESAIHEKRSTNGQASKSQSPSGPRLRFSNFYTGVWEYNHSGQLIFGSKYKDARQGTLTFGKNALVIYLAATTQGEFNWHCRIDISYGIIEHVIPSHDSTGRGTFTLTLKSPPKIYKVNKTDDLHLYYGGEVADEGPGMPALDALTLDPAAKRLLRECAILPAYDKNSALCMVYRFTLPDVESANRAWLHVSRSSALYLGQRWGPMIPLRISNAIENDFQRLNGELSLGLIKKTPHFDFAVRFQLLALVLEGTLAPTLMLEFIPYVKLLCKESGSELAARGIRKLQYQIPTPGPNVHAQELSLSHIVTTLHKNLQDLQDLEATSEDVLSKQKQHSHLVLTYKATITPTGMLLRGPDLSVSNRILRRYSGKSEYFMRVFFGDEDGLSVLHDPRAGQDHVYIRFHQILRDGIDVAGRRYSFLGFSHSSLHDHTAWFMAPFVIDGQDICSTKVIGDLGDFTHIHCSAKCAARIGQAFSDTIFAVPIPQDAYVTEFHPDVERNERCFSDGCGTISKALLEEIWAKLPRERRKLMPTVLQIRYRGAKGVISLDSSLRGKQLRLRKSMTKYSAREGWRDLEICDAAYAPLLMYLNHQYVKILEDRGVPHSSFIAVQGDALQELSLVLKHPINAANFLEISRSGVAAKMPTLIVLMHEIGLRFQADRFLTDIVEVAVMSSLRDLKYRARIPVQKGHLLYGIMDETNELKEGEVYIPTAGRDEFYRWRRHIVTGDRVVVTRAPALHPGDIQIVSAVDVSQESPLRDLYNCIVFSQQGARDLASQLGGGDLDGDLFHVIYDERLIPPTTVAPSEYPPTLAKDLGRPVQVNDITDFFIEYMRSDRLGQISNKHKIRADLKPLGTMDPDCIILAKLSSDAVDFSKSGKPVDMSLVPKGTDRNRPDFMASGPGLVLSNAGVAELEAEDEDDVDDPDSINLLDHEKLNIRYYKSHKILGILYRKIQEPSFFSDMKNKFETIRNSWGSDSVVLQLERYVDRETTGLQWEHHRGFAVELRQYYEGNMLEIMDTLRPHRGKPLTELEVFSGNILGKKEKASNRHIREANLEVQERFNRDVSSIVRRIVSGEGLEDEEVESLPRAIACFKIALDTKGWEDNAHMKSWKYVTAAVCLEQLWQYMNFKLRPI